MQRETPNGSFDAVALLSGGLDSTLATAVVQEQGKRVLGLHCLTGFESCEYGVSDCQGAPASPPVKASVLNAAKILQIPLRTVDIFDEMTRAVASPRHGRGANLNPCIDCKIIMLGHAGRTMGQVGASCVVTGEVLGQRPMSQHRQALDLIERRSGLEGRLVRPLSAKLLPPSLVEREGFLDRDLLLDISGRGRRRLMDLMAERDISDYPAPGGGCLLTDASFCARLRDKMEHSEPGRLRRDDIALLLIGRHLRIGPDLKLIVGRNQEENLRLAELARGGCLLETRDVPGPNAFIEGSRFGGEEVRLCASIAARYSDGRNLRSIRFSLSGSNLSGDSFRAEPFRDEGRLREWTITT